MDAKEVVSKILAEAKAEADSVKAEAQQQAKAQQDQFDAQMKRFEEDTRTQAERAAREAKSQQMAKARMDIKKRHVEKKALLLNEVFAKAMDKLLELPDDQYKDLMASLMLKATQTGDEEIIIGKDEKRIDQALIKKVNDQLGGDKKSNLKLSSDRADIKGGFILSRGKVNVNASAQVLISQTREQSDIEIAQELFEG